jgi:hypothetical protein
LSCRLQQQEKNMTERIINLLLLAVAIAHLATDVLHLGSETSPRRSINDPVPIPARSGAQEMARPPPRNDPPADWESHDRRTEAAKSTFRRLPLDFSINQPPWCPACRHHDRPRLE